MVAERTQRKGDHMVSVVTEHRAVLDPMQRLGRRGFDVTLLEVEWSLLFRHHIAQVVATGQLPELGADTLLELLADD